MPAGKQDKGALLPPPILGLASSLVAVFLDVEINSEQNRLNPPPLTVNDASEGFFLFVVK